MPTLIGESYYGSQAQQDDLDAMSLKTNTGVIVFFAEFSLPFLPLFLQLKAKSRLDWSCFWISGLCDWRPLRHTHVLLRLAFSQILVDII
jgi:hypothetical protein